MKNKYARYDEIYKRYSEYVDINEYMTDYISEYNGYNWTETKPSETEDERLAREKAKLRNSKIDQLLGE
jgi:hypothetical protein